MMKKAFPCRRVENVSSAVRQELPAELPRRGNRLSHWIGRGLLRLSGWRIEGRFPHRPKLVVLVAPHTSNWDFFFGICVVLALGLRAHWMGKHTLFRWGVGHLLCWLGGIPVNRAAPYGVVEQMVERFRKQESFVLGIAPEGTRKKVTHWKTGFHRIAVQAQVPLVLAYIDYQHKVVGFGPEKIPSDNLEKDLEEIQAFYRQWTPRHPEKF